MQLMTSASCRSGFGYLATTSLRCRTKSDRMCRKISNCLLKCFGAIKRACSLSVCPSTLTDKYLSSSRQNSHPAAAPPQLNETACQFLAEKPVKVNKAPSRIAVAVESSAHVASAVVHCGHKSQPKSVGAPKLCCRFFRVRVH